jgi:hypothetical protein
MNAPPFPRIPLRRLRAAALACPLALAACAGILGIDPPVARDAGADGTEGTDGGVPFDGTVEAPPDAPVDARPDVSLPPLGDGGMTLVNGQSGTVLVAVTDIELVWANANSTGSSLWSCSLSDPTSCNTPRAITQAVTAPVGLVAIDQGVSSKAVFATADGTIDVFTANQTLHLANGIVGLKAIAATGSPPGGTESDTFFYTTAGNPSVGAAPGVYVRYGPEDWKLLNATSGTPLSVVSAVGVSSTSYGVAFTIPKTDPFFCEDDQGTASCSAIPVRCPSSPPGCGVPSDHFVAPALTSSKFAFETTMGLWVATVPTPLMATLVDPAEDVTAITVLDNIVVWARSDGVRAGTFPPTTSIPPKVFGAPGHVYSLASNASGVYAAVDEGIVFYPRDLLQ